MGWPSLESEVEGTRQCMGQFFTQSWQLTHFL